MKQLFCRFVTSLTVATLDGISEISYCMEHVTELAPNSKCEFKMFIMSVRILYSAIYVIQAQGWHTLFTLTLKYTRHIYKTIYI